MKKIALVILIFSAVTASAQMVTKKVGLAKGQQLEQQSRMQVNMTQEAMGQTVELKMEGDVTSVVEVKDAVASGFDISNTIKKVMMNMNMMGQDMKFDSDKSEDFDGQLGQAFKGKINVPREFSVSKDGIITKMKTKIDSLDDGGGMMGGMMSAAMENEKEGAAFQSIANIPAKGIKVGESWNDSTIDKVARTYTTYTLKEVTGGNGLVTLSSNMAVSREVEQQGMTIQVEMTGTTIGEYTFDVATGIIKRRKYTSKSSGTLGVAGQSMPMNIETTVESVVNKK